MKTVKGLYNEAKIFAETVDEGAIEQIRAMCSLEFLASSKIRVMPDVHAGKGCTIGTTMTITDAVVSNFVGVDIGCGMETVRIEEKDVCFEKLDNVIRSRIPAGFNIRDTVHANAEHLRMEELYIRDRINMDRALRSLGTLGGGNHFIELDRDEGGDYWLVIHSGSRHAGVETANAYQQMAADRLCGTGAEDMQEVIRTYKEQGREKEIQKALQEIKEKRAKADMSYAYCSGELMDQYIHDMKIMQEYAVWNRRTMAEEIMDGMGWHAAERFCTIHNYIDTEHMILRKGSVSAMKGERLIIPVNMRDGSLICRGLGNEDWNCSAPHGAGRLCSRSEARKTFSMDEYEASMEGIWTTSVNTATIDECPMAYKGMDEIMRCIKDTCMVESVIRPVYNFKAGD